MGLQRAGHNLGIEQQQYCVTKSIYWAVTSGLKKKIKRTEVRIYEMRFSTVQQVLLEKQKNVCFSVYTYAHIYLNTSCL